MAKVAYYRHTYIVYSHSGADTRGGGGLWAPWDLENKVPKGIFFFNLDIIWSIILLKFLSKATFSFLISWKMWNTTYPFFWYYKTLKVLGVSNLISSREWWAGFHFFALSLHFSQNGGHPGGRQSFVTEREVVKNPLLNWVQGAKWVITHPESSRVCSTF